MFHKSKFQPENILSQAASQTPTQQKHPLRDPNLDLGFRKYFITCVVPSPQSLPHQDSLYPSREATMLSLAFQAHATISGLGHPVEKPSESLWHLETRPPLLGQTEGLRPCRSEPARPCDPPGLGGPKPPLKPCSPHQRPSAHSQPCGKHTHGPAPSDLWTAAPSRMSLPVCAGHVLALPVVIHSTTVGQQGWF